jgi:small subunit ribosomal protein S2e
MFVAISNTYGYLTPDLWQEEQLTATPFERFSFVLSKQGKK